MHARVPDNEIRNTVAIDVASTAHDRAEAGKAARLLSLGGARVASLRDGNRAEEQ